MEGWDRLQEGFGAGWNTGTRPPGLEESRTPLARPAPLTRKQLSGTERKGMTNHMPSDGAK